MMSDVTAFWRLGTMRSTVSSVSGSHGSVLSGPSVIDPAGGPIITGVEYGPWCVFDLVVPHVVCAVTVSPWNRPSYLKTSVLPLDLHVSFDGISWQHVIRVPFGDRAWSATFPVFRPIRFIRVRMAGLCDLSIDPIEVTGRPVHNTDFSWVTRYLRNNETQGSPLLYAVGHAGFFSEYHSLLYMILYGILTKRRLMVSSAGFDGLQWEKFFDSPLPYEGADPTTLDEPEIVWRVGGRDKGFHAARARVLEVHEQRCDLNVEELDLRGSCEAVLRKIAASFFRPHAALVASAAQVRDALGMGSEYAAIHLRRGDKVKGYDVGGTMIVEGDDIPPARFLEHLDATAPELRDVFVMTDDYAVIQELKAVGTHRIFSYTAESEAGYDQSEYNKLRRSVRVRQINRLLTEVLVATSSARFVGSYKSNVSRFVYLLHADPGRCESLDGVRTWNPF